MTDRLDYLLTEVDRQLTEVRGHADGIAIRAGLLISATAVAASVLAARVQHIKGGATNALWALGVATVLGIFTLLPWLTVGPGSVELRGWVTGQAKPAVTQLYQAKLITLEGNRLRLAVMRSVFYLQGVAVIVAVVLALVGAGQGR